jgi:hypothetical protein
VVGLENGLTLLMLKHHSKSEYVDGDWPTPQLPSGSGVGAPLPDGQ